jgi:hypothetical protein
MSKPTIRIHNLETDEVIDREMTNPEFSQYQADQVEALKNQAEIQAQAAAKAALLDKLGITADEAKLLLQ